MANRRTLGGVIHTYQRYDPVRFPSPTAEPPDLVSPAFEHLLMYGNLRRLTPEELARAIRIDPSEIAGLGPSLESLRATLLERKRKILAKYETQTVQKTARQAYYKTARRAAVPEKLRRRFQQALDGEQLYDLEQLWYAAGDDSPFAGHLVHLIERLGEKYQVDELAAKYEFTGRTSLSVPEALAVKEELERIDELLKQIEEALKTAQLGVIDLDLLSEFASPGDLENLRAMQQLIQDYLREAAERQGIEREGGSFQLNPQAYRLFQWRLLARIFSDITASRTGRHQGAIVGEGAVEFQATRPYEFGDSLANADLTQSITNMLIRQGGERPLRFHSDDLVVHRTRNTPKCATTVIMDMSGSMRYDGQYMNVKRMALALDGLIRREFPGDFLQFIEMYTFARVCPAREVVELLPKPVTLFDPIVRLKADMSRDDMSESQIPPHFTNIQHALQLARRTLAAQDTPNRQIVLITDGMPTAHFEDHWLYLLYPADPKTEAATLREGLLCQREGITLNLFLVPSWSQSEEDIRFAYRLAETTRGRVFFTSGRDLDHCVVWDYVKRKREILA